MRRRPPCRPPWAPLLLLLAGASLLGPTACGKDDPLKKPDRSGAQCARIRERNIKCWKEMEGQFRGTLFMQGIRRIKTAPKEKRKQMLANHKAGIESQVKQIRATLVDDFITHCKKDWNSPKPAHRQLKKRMLGCLPRKDCKQYAKCFANVHAK